MIDNEKLTARLLDAGLIERNRVENALQFAEKQDASLYEVLIRRELIDERDVVEVASEILNVPCVHLDDLQLDQKTVQMIPEEMAADNKVVPVDVLEEDGARVMKLAMVDPIDVMAMDEISSHTEVDIRPVLAGPADLETAIEAAYGDGGPGELDEESEEPVLLGEEGEFELEDEEAFELEDEDQPRELDDGADGETGDDDSWAEMFDEPDEDDASNSEQSQREEPETDPDTGVVSQEMRDRPTTGAVVVPDDEGDDADDDVAGPAFSKHPAMMDGADTSNTQVASPGQLAGFELDEALEDSSTGEESENNATNIGGPANTGDWDELDDDYYADEDSSDAPEDDTESAEQSDSKAGGDSDPKVELEAEGEDSDAGGEEDEGESNNAVPSSLRSALEKAKNKSASEAKKSGEDSAEKPDGDSGGDSGDGNANRKPRSERSKEEKRTTSSVGRIEVKKKRVPSASFQGAIEKRSDRERTNGDPASDQSEKPRADSPAEEVNQSARDSADEAKERDVEETEEAEDSRDAEEAEDSREFAAEREATRKVDPSEMDGGLGGGKTEVGELDEGIELPDQFDSGVLLEGLIQLILERGLLDSDDVEELIARAAEE